MELDTDSEAYCKSPNNVKANISWWCNEGGRMGQLPPPMTSSRGRWCRWVTTPLPPPQLQHPRYTDEIVCLERLTTELVCSGWWGWPKAILMFEKHNKKEGSGSVSMYSISREDQRRKRATLPTLTSKLCFWGLVFLYPVSCSSNLMWSKTHKLTLWCQGFDKYILNFKNLQS